MPASKQGKRIATVEVRRPNHVPVELFRIWKGAAQSLAKRGKLLTASQKVDYLAVNDEYKRILAGLHTAAVTAGRKASAKRRKSK